MVVKRQFILICLVVVSLTQLPAAFTLPNNHQNKTSSNQILFEPFKLFYTKIIPMVQEVRNNSLDALNNGQITETFNEYVFNDIDCKNPSTFWGGATVTANIQDNGITFDVIDGSITGQILISPNSDLSSFNLDISINAGQLTVSYEINGNTMKCSDLNIPPATQISMSGRICIQTTNFGQVNSRIQSCFILGGALSVKTNVQNIHKTVVSGGAIDMGCYNANQTTISYSGQNRNTNLVKTVSDSTVKPVYKDACGSSGNIVPSLLITFIVALVGFLRASY